MFVVQVNVLGSDDVFGKFDTSKLSQPSARKVGAAKLKNQSLRI